MKTGFWRDLVSRRARSTATRGEPCMKRGASLALAAVVLLGTSGGLAAQEKTLAAANQGDSCGKRLPGDTRPRIGLVLGGGGARGFAHISVLRMLEQMHIPVDCIAGTSMGSLVGGLYASGMSVDQLEELVSSTNWKEMFNDELPRKDRSYRRKQDDRASLTTIGVGVGPDGLKISPGMLQGERILALLVRDTLPVTSISDFDLLPIPFRAIATDLNTGQPVVLDHGSLPMAMRASMSLPGIFQPAEIDGMTLLDGGLVNQVPVDVVRSMGADVVIAVDVGTPMEKLGSDASLLQVVMQMSGMMTTGNTRAHLDTLGSGDVLITPDLGTQVSTGDFTKAREALAIGAVAAEAARPALAHLSLPADSAAWRAHQRPQQNIVMPVIDFVRVDNRTDYADAVFLSYVDIPLGQPLDPARIEHGLLGAYGLGTLSSINYQVIHEGDRNGVLLTASPKPQGPNYLQLGLTLDMDLDGSFDSNLRGALLFSPLSPYGAEGRVSVALGSEPELAGEYWHPLDAASKNVLYMRGGYTNPNINVFNSQGDNVATYDVRAVGIEFQAIHEFGNYGALTLGFDRSAGRARVQVGDPSLEDFDFQQGSFTVKASVDRLDSLFFPQDGYFATLGFTGSREALGSDSNYSQIDFDALGAKSFGKHALQLALGYHSTISGELPVQDRYRLGGRARLSGFRFNELTGQDYALIVAGYTYQLAEVFGRSALVGGTLEYGNAWQRRQDMRFDDGIFNASVYTGFDSWVGPMLMGYGWREGGDGTLFLQIGHPF